MTDFSQTSGMLAVYKPSGMVSKDVSRVLGRLLPKAKMGHVGTLDPLAEGVLPILFGKATRLQDLLLDSAKEYIVDIAFGYETDSLDSDGQIVMQQEGRPAISWPELLRVCKNQCGVIEQVPPLYSAVKYAGRPLYDYARSGQAAQVPLESLKRSVVIQKCEPLELKDHWARIRVLCGKGTYIRVVAQQIAHGLETYGTVVKLVRSQSSGLTSQQAHPLEVIEKSIQSLQSLILPIEEIPVKLMKWQVQSAQQAARLRNGQALCLSYEAFKEGIVPQTRLAVNGCTPQECMLLDEGGHAFGLAQMRQQSDHGLTLGLRRGLV